MELACLKLNLKEIIVKYTEKCYFPGLLICLNEVTSPQFSPRALLSKSEQDIGAYSSKGRAY